jgi:hypothetical protein
MTMQVFKAEMLNGLVYQAKASPRLRQHKNIHTRYCAKFL